MNNFKFTSKLRIFAIISACIIVLGMVLGTVFHFVGGGFFNYGGEYKSYKSVTVSYVWADVTAKEGEESADIPAICQTAFKENGVTAYSSTSSDTGVGEELEFRFSPKTSAEALQKSVDKINADITAAVSQFTDASLSNAVYHEEEAILGGGKALSRAAIALAVIVALQAVYTLIRFGLSAFLAAFAVDINNFGIYAALLAICRIPVAGSALTFGVLAILATAVGTTFLFEKIKRNRKGDATIPLPEAVDISARQIFKFNIALSAVLIVAALVAVILSAISALSVSAIFNPVLCALAAFIAVCYGNVLFAPAVFPVFKKFCDKFFNKPSQKKG